MPPLTLPLRPDAPPLTLDVTPGGEIILRGSYTSTHDGSVVDAATTTWPAGAPGGASVDPGGLVDFAAGGFHVTSRDPVTHEVHAIATGEAGPACTLAGVTHCLPLRLREGARGRLLKDGDWARSLKGAIAVEVVAPPAYAPAATAARDAAPWLAAVGSVLGLTLGAAAIWRFHKKRAASPRAQLLALARQVQAKAHRADPILAAPLAPALDGALRRLEADEIDPTTAEGIRVRAMLQRVDTRLDEASHQARSQREQALADELTQDIELAFEAADEARLPHRPPPSPP